MLCPHCNAAVQGAPCPACGRGFDVREAERLGQLAYPLDTVGVWRAQIARPYSGRRHRRGDTPRDCRPTRAPARRARWSGSPLYRGHTGASTDSAKVFTDAVTGGRSGRPSLDPTDDGSSRSGLGGWRRPGAASVVRSRRTYKAHNAPTRSCGSLNAPASAHKACDAPAHNASARRGAAIAGRVAWSAAPYMASGRALAALGPLGGLIDRGFVELEGRLQSRRAALRRRPRTG